MSKGKKFDRRGQQVKTDLPESFSLWRKKAYYGGGYEFRLYRKESFVAVFWSRPKKDKIYNQVVDSAKHEDAAEFAAWCQRKGHSSLDLKTAKMLRQYYEFRIIDLSREGIEELMVNLDLAMKLLES